MAELHHRMSATPSGKTSSTPEGADESSSSNGLHGAIPLLPPATQPPQESGRLATDSSAKTTPSPSQAPQSQPPQQSLPPSKPVTGPPTHGGGPGGGLSSYAQQLNHGNHSKGGRGRGPRSQFDAGSEYHTFLNPHQHPLGEVKDAAPPWSLPGGKVVSRVLWKA